MKNLILLFILVACSAAQIAAPIVGGSSVLVGPGCAGNAYGRFTCVSANSGFTASNTVRNATIAVATGDVVTIIGQVITTGSTIALSDSGACTGAINSFGGSLALTSSVAIAGLTVATGTGTCTMTMTWAGAANTLTSSIQDWRGSTGTVDVSGALASVTGTTNVSCPAVTTTVNNDLVLCMMVETGNNGLAYTSGTGFKLTLGGQSASQEAQVQAASGAITPQFSYAQAGTFGVVTVALE